MAAPTGRLLDVDRRGSGWKPRRYLVGRRRRRHLLGREGEGEGLAVAQDVSVTGAPCWSWR